MLIKKKNHGSLCVFVAYVCAGKTTCLTLLRRCPMWITLLGTLCECYICVCVCPIVHACKNKGHRCFVC